MAEDASQLTTDWNHALDFLRGEHNRLLPALVESARRGHILPEAYLLGFTQTLSYTATRSAYLMGQLSVEKLLDAVQGRPLPRVIDTGVVFVDRGNLDSYPEGIEREKR